VLPEKASSLQVPADLFCAAGVPGQDEVTVVVVEGVTNVDEQFPAQSETLRFQLIKQAIADEHRRQYDRSVRSLFIAACGDICPAQARSDSLCS